jgi:syntaxin 16
MAQLADLFHGLNSLVIDQGALLDRVDYNVEQLNRHMEGACIELRFAAGHQHSTRKRLCIWLLVFLILGTGLGLLLKQ